VREDIIADDKTFAVRPVFCHTQDCSKTRGKERKPVFEDYQIGILRPESAAHGQPIPWVYRVYQLWSWIRMTRFILLFLRLSRKEKRGILPFKSDDGDLVAFAKGLGKQGCIMGNSPSQRICSTDDCDVHRLRWPEYIP